MECGECDLLLKAGTSCDTYPSLIPEASQQHGISISG